MNEGPNIDSRKKPVQRRQLAMENQSVVFSMFNSDEKKLTVADVYELVRRHNESLDQAPLHERTIRRALESLVKAGFLVEIGKRNNAIIYGKQSASFAGNESGGKLIPGPAGNLVSVEEFFKTFADFDLNPFAIEVPALARTHRLVIQRRMLFAVFSAQDPGFADELRTTAEILYKYLAEMEHASKVLRVFLDSSIWHEQYRDRMAYEIRRLQEKNPELFQLTHDAIKGG